MVEAEAGPGTGGMGRGLDREQADRERHREVSRTVHRATGIRGKNWRRKENEAGQHRKRPCRNEKKGEGEEMTRTKDTEMARKNVIESEG